MTEIKPRYKLILHLSDSSTLIFTITEPQLQVVLVPTLNLKYNFDGTVVFFNHVMYMQIIDLTTPTTSLIPADKEEIKSSYVGSN